MEELRRVAFGHEKEAAKHRRTRKANSMNAGRDRYYEKRYWHVDTKMVKRQLHKANRIDPDVVSSTYYKHRSFRLGTVLYGMS